jgi:CheY-like chemotaxis protein
MKPFLQRAGMPWGKARVERRKFLIGQCGGSSGSSGSRHGRGVGIPLPGPAGRDAHGNGCWPENRCGKDSARILVCRGKVAFRRHAALPGACYGADFQKALEIHNALPRKSGGVGLSDMAPIHEEDAVADSLAEVVEAKTPAARRYENTTFKVYFPRVEGLPEDTSPDTPRPDVRGKKGILLVEDDTSVRTLTGSFLSGLGYDVHSFANGIDALAALDRLPATIALLING